MCREDAFKVLSYLTDYIEKESNIEPCSQKSVATLDKAIDSERLGFTRVNIQVGKNEDDIIDLFTVTGRLALFKQREYYSKYFEWYTENVTLEEVKGIYNKCGIEFHDLIPMKSQEESSKTQNRGKILNKTYP